MAQNLRFVNAQQGETFARTVTLAYHQIFSRCQAYKLQLDTMCQFDRLLRKYLQATFAPFMTKECLEAEHKSTSTDDSGLECDELPLPFDLATAPSHEATFEDKIRNLPNDALICLRLSMKNCESQEFLYDASCADSSSPY